MIHPGYHPCQGGSATNVKLVKTANQNVRCTPRAMFSSRSQRSEKSNDSDAALSTATVSCPATDREGPWPNRYGSCTPPTATLKRSLIWCFEHQWDGNHGMLLMTSENTCERKLKDEHECGKFTIYIHTYINQICDMCVPISLSPRHFCCTPLKDSSNVAARRPVLSCHASCPGQNA